MNKLKSSFIAKDDDEQDHIIDIYIDPIAVGTHDGDPNETIEGIKRLRTRNGEKVIRIDKGKYKNMQTGLLLHSDSPDAP